MNVRISLGCVLLLLLAATPALAQAPAAAPLPEWDQLSAQQRDALVAPMRERWNRDPGARARMLEHAHRWQAMSPEERARARKGMRHFEGMGPVQRRQARALFEHMRALEPAQRNALRAQWRAMSPEQRQAWVERHPPSERSEPEPGR